MQNELKNIQAFFTERRERCLSVSALEKEERLKEMKLELKEMKFQVANELVNGNYFEAKQGFNSILTT